MLAFVRSCCQCCHLRHDRQYCITSTAQWLCGRGSMVTGMLYVPRVSVRTAGPPVFLRSAFLIPPTNTAINIKAIYPHLKFSTCPAPAHSLSQRSVRFCGEPHAAHRENSLMCCGVSRQPDWAHWIIDDMPEDYARGQRDFLTNSWRVHQRSQRGTIIPSTGSKALHGRR